jgi:hypothetical protein
MKPLLCKLGFHKLDQSRYLVSTRKRPGRKAYHRNYFICKRCGKKIDSFAIRINKEVDRDE